MNNIRDAIFRFFLKPYCFRRMTIFLLAHPKKTNIIRTRERIIRIFPQTHTHAHTRKKGNVMYILLLLVFPRRAASHRTNSQQQKRSSSAVATPSSSVRSCFFLLSFVFQSIEENCQIFLLSVFFLLGTKRKPASKTFPSSLFRVATAQQILGSTQHTLSHTTADGRFALLRGAALAGVFVGKFDRVSTGLGTPHAQDLHPRSAGVSSITPHRTWGHFQNTCTAHLDPQSSGESSAAI